MRESFWISDDGEWRAPLAVIAVNQVESVPSIQESAATGEIAEIYADIRATLGTSVVNLVWRNLATLPGALPWTWSTVRPFYSGLASERAEAVRHALPLPKLPPISADALTAAGLSANDIEQIRQILDSYHHTNALALVVLSALLERDQPSAAKPTQLTDTSPPLVRTELPPLPAMATLQPAVQRLIVELNGFGEDDAPVSDCEHVSASSVLAAVSCHHPNRARTASGRSEPDRADASRARPGPRPRRHIIERVEVLPSTAVLAGRPCVVPTVRRASDRPDDRDLCLDPRCDWRCNTARRAVRLHSSLQNS